MWHAGTDSFMSQKNILISLWLQVYKPASQAFFYLDKYAGRNIHHASFKQSLLSFLDNGTHYLIGFIPSLIKKLQALFDVIKTLPSCRFYASSLLVLYDGFSFETSTDMDIRIIDFANCVTNADVLHESSLQGLLPHVPCPPTTLGPDQGYLLGLNTLMRNFEELYQELGGALHGGHVPKEKIPKSARATAEVGLADMGDRSGGPLSALAQASTPGPLSSAPNAPVTLSPSLVDQPSISRPIFTADPPKSSACPAAQ